MARVLLVAYSCVPGESSESGLGWEYARRLAEHHDLTLLTRPKGRELIEEARRRAPGVRLRTVYFEPAWLRRLGRTGLPVSNLRYLLWQHLVVRVGRRLCRLEPFDLVHHVNWVRSWMPIGAAAFGPPLVWGPVGASETLPASFLGTLGAKGAPAELVRSVARALFSRDPLARRARLEARAIVSATAETGAWLRERTSRPVDVFPSVGISAADLEGVEPSGPPFEHAFVSLGRLLAWKGFHLALEAFAECGLADARYAVIGDGPEGPRLRRLARRLGIDDRVDFLGAIARHEALEVVSRAGVLVHPSLHDSGGFAVLEAMALGKPVVCLDVGGPAVIAGETGVRVEVTRPATVIQDLAAAMRDLMASPDRYRALSAAASARASTELSWDRKIDFYDAVYRRVTGGAG